MCSHYNLDCITKQDLSNWLTGLESPLNSYAHKILDTEITSLSALMSDEELLSSDVIPKIGHLINIRHKLNSLIKVLYDVKDETVESLVMKYQRGARSLEGIIRHKRYEFAPQMVHSATIVTVPNNVLSHVCDILATGREICTWLVKPPFSEHRHYIDLAETFLTTNKEIGYCVVGDRWKEELEKDLLVHCKKIQDLCRNFLDSSDDSSIISPAFLELVKLRRTKPEEKIGLIFKLSLENIHTVSGIRENTPASRCNRLAIMDEIVQIDFTCVTNWTLDSILNKFKQASPKEVCLTLRKRPRHMNLSNHLRRMKILVPPDFYDPKIAEVKSSSKKRPRKHTPEMKYHNPSSTPGPGSPKKNSTDGSGGGTRKCFIGQESSKMGIDALPSVVSYSRASMSRNSVTTSRGHASSRRRSSSVTSLHPAAEETKQPPSIPCVPVVTAAATPPVILTPVINSRQEVLPSVSSCDPSTSSGALSSSDQDTSSVFHTPLQAAPVNERHSVIDRRVSIKDLGETEISGNLYRKKFESDWVLCHCVIKDGCFYVFANSEAEKADLVVHLKSLDIAKADEQDNFKFVFTMKLTNQPQSKLFIFAAANRSDLGHWVNNLHTAKLLLRSKKTSVAARNFLAVELEIEETLSNNGDLEDNEKPFNESIENFSETDDEGKESESKQKQDGTSDGTTEMEKSMRMLRSSFLGGPTSNSHTPFSRSTTVEEPPNSTCRCETIKNSEYCQNEEDLGSSSISQPVAHLRENDEAAANYDVSNSGARSTLSGDVDCSERALLSSNQSVKFVLVGDANEKAAGLIWEEPSTELDRLQSKLRALERKLQAKLMELDVINKFIALGEKDPSQLASSYLYHEQTSGLTWNTNDDDDEQSIVDTEL